MTDSISKLIPLLFPDQTCDPLFRNRFMSFAVMAAIEVLVNQLQAHRLDIVLADEPASSSLKAKDF